MTDREKYVAFMCNEENEFNCENCPENQGCDDWQGRYPCGQWNCWVTCHCKNDEED